MEKAVKNVLYFFNDVLRSVGREGKWTSEALEKAVNWAYYCEKVYIEAVDKGLADQLSDALNGSAGCTDSEKFIPSLESLRNAPQLLFMELLRQSSLKPAISNFLLTSRLMSEPWARDVIFDTFTTSSVAKSLTNAENDAR
ncbi:uncharacterized protein LOC135394575 [Ornithodoros turicata]|uniref:uncharacterized protein LOC135394575 n=1 Tax=Ornithodoros turicata TaxID=34597 RepID=UPI003138CE78